MMPTMRKRYSLRVALNIEHYSERFGLLTIIALGMCIQLTRVYARGSGQGHMA